MITLAKSEITGAKGRYGGLPDDVEIGPPIEYTSKNCYDPLNDVCNLGHPAGTGSPLDKCCRYCNEFGQHPGGIIVIDGEEISSK